MIEQCRYAFPDGITSRLRKRGYDYAQPGAYFITCCTFMREPLLGSVSESRFHPTPLGLAITEEWLKLEERFPTVVLLEHQTMPDHFHGVLHLNPCLDAGMKPPTLSAVIGAFKSLSARRYHALRDAGQCADIGRTPWQDKFHDSIQWTDDQLEETCKYIILNPRRWSQRYGV